MPPVTRGQHGPLQVAPRISPEAPRRRNNRTARITLKRNMNGVSKGTTKKFFCKRSQACQRLQDACKSSSFQSLKASEPPRLVNLQSSEHQYGSGGMRVALKSAATRRVGACPNGFRNLLRILRTQRVQPGPAQSAPPQNSIS